ncbi:MAG: acetoacetyl-CoA reductase [Gammaproteobacteria bacterium]|nr:acetoacetyl-CoA reductase [Gammaproteobacteria bacterium]
MSSKIALVTGGIGGIGTEICKELCTQGRMVIAGHLPDELEKATEWRDAMREENCQAEIVAGDVSCFESSEQMVREVEKTFGPIEVLVNCAGITRDRTLRKMDPGHWKAVIDTNLDSVFNVTRHVVEGMIEREFGRVVNVSSVNGQKGQFGQTNYSAAKAGVHGFTMALAQEVARKGVTVNTISPGYVETRMTAQVPEEIRHQIVETIPVGRMATPSEIAHVVGFLCDDRTTYITGANVPVNGGMYMA